MCEDFDVLAAI